jgi:hypothetical protein
MVHPTLIFDYARNRLLADNIWNAQMAGHPKVLTHSGPDLMQRREARRGAMHFEHEGGLFEIPHILSRDEYPFACTLEGGRASWVGHIPPTENSAQGGLIAAFLRQNVVAPRRGEMSKFLVRIVNHPKGPVTVPCKPPCASCRPRCKYI